MQTTFKLFFSYLFCLSLTFLSGCGGGGVPSFTPAEQAEIDKFCAEHGSDVKAVDERGMTLLHEAVRNGTSTVIKFLISEGAEVNAKDNITGFTPLHLASQFAGDVEITKLLVSKGANVNAKSDLGITPLHMAQNVEIAKFLVSKGADVNSQGNSGSTPLDLATSSGKIAVAEYLSSVGAKSGR